jgi:hypothetical protein
MKFKLNIKISELESIQKLKLEQILINFCQENDKEIEIKWERYD